RYSYQNFQHEVRPSDQIHHRIGTANAYPLLRRFLFVFQAEDGIRDRNVTGVQTCALPILWVCDQLPELEWLSADPHPVADGKRPSVNFVHIIGRMPMFTHIPQTTPAFACLTTSTLRQRCSMAAETVTPVQRQSVRETFKHPALLRTEILAGLVVSLALIPEAIAFALIANVVPKVGLYAAGIMAMSIAFLGGRPAMISAATAATALVVAPIVASHGVQYLFATVILAGVLQIVLGVIGVAKLMKFIPQSVMTGFVNALAILIFVAQLPDLIDVPWAVYPLFALGL